MSETKVRNAALRVVELVREMKTEIDTLRAHVRQAEQVVQTAEDPGNHLEELLIARNLYRSAVADYRMMAGEVGDGAEDGKYLGRA